MRRSLPVPMMPTPATPPSTRTRDRNAARTRHTLDWTAQALFALFLLMSPTGVASAASLVVDGNGQLLGARDVDVSGTLYEVQFRDDTFANIFGDASGLDATSQADAVSFAQALLGQVLIDSDAGQFDADPELTNGCENFNECRALVPYSVSGAVVSNVIAIEVLDDK